MHLYFSNGFLPLTLLALDKSEPCGYFPFATAASPAPATFSLSASSLSARKDGPLCPIIHSLLYCITPATDSLWTERSYHSSGMSAVFFFRSVHHFHLSTLQPFSLPAMIVYLETVPTVMHPEMSASKWFSSKRQQAWA